MPLAFSKWEGLGNDFVILEGRAEDPAGLARELCDRHYGIGADGLLLLLPGPGMEVWNSDGSPAAMCGNGLRCVAAYARRQGVPGSVFATGSGPREARILSEDPWRVQVDMGAPEFLASGVVSMGNPHRVVFVEDVAAVDLAGDGRRLEGSLAGGVNVEFVEVRSPRHLVVRVWERGAGATLACGTGACAALAAASSQGLCGRSARVDLPGGAMDIEWGEDGRIRMTGPAREVFRGVWRPDRRA